MRFLSAAMIACLAAPAISQQPPTAPRMGPRPVLTLSSTSFEDGGVLPDKYTSKDPHPVSPAIQWTNVPASVVTLVFIMHDADAADQRKSEDYLHWMAFNIPPTATGFPEGEPATASLPDGTVQAKNSRGAVGYMGPGAPPGPYHHYIFELYGLDTKLDLGQDATRAEVMKAMDGHVVAKAAITARFHR